MIAKAASTYPRFPIVLGALVAVVLLGLFLASCNSVTPNEDENASKGELIEERRG